MGQNQLRKGRQSEPARAYLITTVTRERRPLFTDLWHARLVIRSLAHLHNRGEVISLAYVLMPDHLHWLFVLQERTLSRIVQSLKSYTGRKLSRTSIFDDSVWQPGFHDRAVRTHEDLKAVARYVVANPLRAGLAESISDYPHWDSIWLGHTLDW